jgi:hypothetical protein
MQINIDNTLFARSAMILSKQQSADGTCPEDNIKLIRFSLKPLCVQIGSIWNRLQSFPVIRVISKLPNSEQSYKGKLQLIRSRIDSILCCLPGTCHQQTVAWIKSWLILQTECCLCLFAF